MELGIIGLGRIGANMMERLILGGHRVISFALRNEFGSHAVKRG